MKIVIHQMVKITRRGVGFGEKARIVSLPDAKGSYEVQTYWSLQTFRLRRRDFVVLSRRKKH